MAQTTRGGRELINQLLADLADLDHAADLDRKTVIFDPQGAYEALTAIRKAARILARRIEYELPPLLERAAANREAANLPDRVARVEQELAELRETLARRPDLRLVDRDRREG